MALPEQPSSTKRTLNDGSGQLLMAFGHGVDVEAPRKADRPSPESPTAPGEYRLLFRLQLFKDGWGLYPDVRYVSPEGIVGDRAPGAFSNALARARATPRETNALGFMHEGHGKGLPGFKKANVFEDRARASYVFQQLRSSHIYTSANFRSRLVRHPEPLSFRLNVLAQGENAFGLHLVLGDGRDLEITVDASIRVLTVDGGAAYVYASGVLYEAVNCPPVQLLDLFIQGEPPTDLPFGGVLKWLDRLPPELADGVARDLSGAIEPEIVRDFKRCRLALSDSVGDRLEARCTFVYGDAEHEMPALPRLRTSLLSENGAVYRIERDKNAESRCLKAITASGLEHYGEAFRLRADVSPLRFLLHDLARLEEAGFEVTGIETLSRFKIRRTEPTLRVDVQSHVDWFDLNVTLDFDGIQAHVAEIMDAIRKKADHVELSDGSVAPLAESLRQAIRFLTETGRQGPRAESIRLTRAQVLAAEGVVGLADERRTDDAFEAQLARLQHFEGLERTAPSPLFRGQLRDYQQAGLDWLDFLRTYGFGGILADDMGLGKTIQTLALLQLRRNGKREPDLIVAPTSLVYNWHRETERFTPNLTVLNYTGSARTRDLKDFHRHDLVLTNYALLRRDAEFLAQVDYRYVILDESQHIKNPHSQTFKAAMRLQGRHRLCLTGTPVENSTIELWSQMHFVNPGSLGSLNGFKERFASPIEKYGDLETADRLRRLTRPFILRRRKDDVAADLPPKIEQVVFCEMEDEQRAFYEKWRDYYRAGLLESIEADGLEKSRMKVLEGLTCLRQISNHPRLVEPKFDQASGKFDYLMEALDELREEGHKVLVFSQFVKMLDVVRGELDRRGVRYAYLDGRTRDRQSEVEAFQNDERVSHFLISLRAGGTGLNLTAADYVVIVDPWWNPAVEMQAVDRSHRIGQDKSVVALKLITRDSVEEKILDLQERKKRLTEDVIATDESFVKALSIEDVEAFFGISARA